MSNGGSQMDLTCLSSSSLLATPQGASSIETTVASITSSSAAATISTLAPAPLSQIAAAAEEDHGPLYLNTEAMGISDTHMWSVEDLDTADCFSLVALTNASKTLKHRISPEMLLMSKTELDLLMDAEDTLTGSSDSGDDTHPTTTTSSITTTITADITDPTTTTTTTSCPHLQITNPTVNSHNLHTEFHIHSDIIPITTPCQSMNIDTEVNLVRDPSSPSANACPDQAKPITSIVRDATIDTNTSNSTELDTETQRPGLDVSIIAQSTTTTTIDTAISPDMPSGIHNTTTASVPASGGLEVGDTSIPISNATTTGSDTLEVDIPSLSQVPVVLPILDACIDHVGVSQSSTVRYLTSWFVLHRDISGDDQVFFNRSRWIVVAGILCDSDGVSTTKQTWSSSLIADALNSRTLSTLSGKQYILLGDMNKHEAYSRGFDEQFYLEFRNGFPGNWKLSLERALDTLELSNSTRKKRSQSPSLDRQSSESPLKRQKRDVTFDLLNADVAHGSGESVQSLPLPCGITHPVSQPSKLEHDVPIFVSTGIDTGGLKSTCADTTVITFKDVDTHFDTEATNAATSLDGDTEVMDDAISVEKTIKLGDGGEVATDRLAEHVMDSLVVGDNVRLGDLSEVWPIPVDHYNDTPGRACQAASFFGIEPGSPVLHGEEEESFMGCDGTVSGILNSDVVMDATGVDDDMEKPAAFPASIPKQRRSRKSILRIPDEDDMDWLSDNGRVCSDANDTTLVVVDSSADTLRVSPALRGNATFRSSMGDLEDDMDDLTAPIFEPLFVGTSRRVSTHVQSNMTPVSKIGTKTTRRRHTMDGNNSSSLARKRSKMNATAISSRSRSSAHFNNSVSVEQGAEHLSGVRVVDGVAATTATTNGDAVGIIARNVEVPRLTRSGRSVVRPLAYWKSERKVEIPVKDLHGTVKSFRPVIVVGAQSAWGELGPSQ
ncbi:hypothetical protein BASA50_003798 [Batrachochytrium salamandrivorans]|uniref:SANTA domain-containing protein n=1 Tax=Batrachochytrium salamandrivorans TaxID=1357716 RepID=A0ABQ8FHP8_9FUNG|nr:hypothetical protein BASA60_005552 [Batrachochytrium salamandrivorans]KAH6574868.1 hypothetical protein BASA62_002233 [Batrachochytrium salamandrivorans]KAH6583974.1 hypothetical protein BASA61_007736 [Batrachochytrium salamandrivorans]KAH6598377.1 hypothetical protein BASA50_003798 [Batrachochytrium salamandrivorans]